MVHVGERAARSSESVNALAYTMKNNIVFGEGQYRPNTVEGRKPLSHELTHVLQQTDQARTTQIAIPVSTNPEVSMRRMIDVRTPVSVQERLIKLNPEMIKEAIAFNKSKFSDPDSILIIRDLLRIERVAIIDEDMIRAIAEHQLYFPLNPDGKIDSKTFEYITQELWKTGDAGKRHYTILLIVDFFKMPTQGMISISYNNALVESNAVTHSKQIPGDSIVLIGPSAFENFPKLVHTVRHELEHVQQLRAGIENVELREFLAESMEILSAEMPEEDIADFMSDAHRAILHWFNLSPEERKANWTQFERVRDEVHRRFNTAPAEDQKNHIYQNILFLYNQFHLFVQEK
jgi:hypothetical protein